MAVVIGRGRSWVYEPISKVMREYLSRRVIVLDDPVYKIPAVYFLEGDVGWCG